MSETYNICAQHGDVMTEDAKIIFLFKKINHSILEGAIMAVKVNIITEPAGTVIYTTVADHISTAVSELPDYLAKNYRDSGINDDSSSNGILIPMVPLTLVII